MESPSLRHTRLARVRGRSTRESPHRSWSVAELVPAVAVLGVLAVLGAGAPAAAAEPSGVIVPASGAAAGTGPALVARVATSDAPVALHGSSVAGEIYVSLEPAAGVDRVTFYLDNPERVGKAFRTENNPPFDFGGGTATVPRSWNTASKPDGSHTITAAIVFDGGSTLVIDAIFTVSNAVAPVPGDGGGGDGGGGGGGGDDGSTGGSGHSLRVRSTPSASSASLQGATVSGEVYVTLEPVTGVDDVRFWLDDPDRSGAPYRFENNPPFDFAGGSATAANSWDTAEISDGTHVITAEIIFLDGGTEVVSAQFAVGNTVPAVVSDRSSIDFPFAAGVTGSATSSAQISLSTGASAPFTLQAPQAGWLSIGVSSVLLPTTLSISVNSNGLAAGEHLAVVSVSSVGYAPASLTVRVTIGSAPPPPDDPPTEAALLFGDDLVRHDFSLDAPGAGESAVALSASDGGSGPFTLSFAGAPWLSVSPTAGTIPATIQIAVDSSGLAAGVHEREIIAQAAGYAPASVMVRVVVASGDASVATSVSRHGITWNFDGEYEVGQFANGDWYVVGPVLITSTSPSWTGTYDGAMINPVYHDDHGYDSRWDYDASLRVSTTNLLLEPGESLIQVDSWRNGEAGAPSTNNTLGISRPAIKSAAVLTCLAVAPPPGTFRPPYAGSAKPLHNVSDLRTWLLPQLDAPPGTPSLASVADKFDGVWLDHTEKWTNRYLHPSDHMEDYGRDLTSEYNEGSCMLMLDFTDAQKQTLLIRLVQIGIDMHAVIQTGGRWGNDGGGHGSGRKWPILLAGVLLDDPQMMSIGTTYGPDMSQEDCQVFYLDAASASDYPGNDIGDPVWGERHCAQPSTDPGSTGYRTCCTANAWVGAIISVHILSGETNIDVKGLWNHDALFDYMDLYMDEQTPGAWQRSWSDFQEAMWDQYRADYGPVYVN